MSADQLIDFMSQQNKSSYQKIIGKPIVSWFFIIFILIAILIVLLFPRELPTNQEVEKGQIELNENAGKDSSE